MTWIARERLNSIGPDWRLPAFEPSFRAALQDPTLYPPLFSDGAPSTLLRPWPIVAL